MAAPAKGFGALLRQYRTRGKLTPLDLAIRADVSRSHLCRLELGTRHPPRETIEALADAMTLDPRDRALLLVSAGYVPLMDPNYRDMCATLAAHWASTPELARLAY